MYIAFVLSVSSFFLSSAVWLHETPSTQAHFDSSPEAGAWMVKSSSPIIFEAKTRPDPLSPND